MKERHNESSPTIIRRHNLEGEIPIFPRRKYFIEPPYFFPDFTRVHTSDRPRKLAEYTITSVPFRGLVSFSGVVSVPVRIDKSANTVLFDVHELEGLGLKVVVRVKENERISFSVSHPEVTSSASADSAGSVHDICPRRYPTERPTSVIDNNSFPPAERLGTK